MKTFAQLNEELNDYQKNMADVWARKAARKRVEPRAVSLSAHVIPRGTDRIVLPFNPPQAEVSAPKDIHNHLKKSGYKIKDYSAGMAIDPSGRDVKIGKVLVKTDRHDLLAKFNADPRRQKTAERQIVISRHPHDVAAMSTGRGWTSCMRLPADKRARQFGDYGEYHECLGGDINRGTHVAYLTHAGDDEAKNPIARIAIKPLETEDSNGRLTHTTLRPDSGVYGQTRHTTLGQHFHNAVTAWTHQHFPVSQIHSELHHSQYDDGIQQAHPLDNPTSSAAHKWLSDATQHELRHTAFYGVNKLHEAGWSHPDHNVRHSVLHHISDYGGVDDVVPWLKDPHPEVREYAAERLYHDHGVATPVARHYRDETHPDVRKHIEDMFRDGDDYRALRRYGAPK